MAQAAECYETCTRCRSETVAVWQDNNLGVQRYSYVSAQIGEDMKSTREPKAALSNKNSNSYIEARQSIPFSRYDTQLTIGKD